MTDAEIIKGNTLIAEFMRVQDPNNDTYKEMISYHGIIGRFHLSWDWLTPVIKKLHKVSWAAHDNFRKVDRWDLDRTYKVCIGLIKFFEKEPTLLYKNK